MALVRTPEEVQKHFDQICRIVEGAGNVDEAVRIEQLGRALVQLSQPSIFPDQELARPVYLEAQRKLLEIDGHAIFYRDKILKAKNNAFTNGEPSTEPAYHGYTRERMWSLQRLSHLPSLETMDVLSNFLDDTDRPSGEEGDLGYYNSLAVTCTTTLRKLIQEDAKKDYALSWREWRDEVRAGRLTFRFKGSDIRYNFEGPVPEKEERSSKPLPSESSNLGEDGNGENRGIETQSDKSAAFGNKYVGMAAIVLLASVGCWALSKWMGER